MSRPLTKSAGMLDTPMGERKPMAEIDGFPSVESVTALIESDRRGERTYVPTFIDAEIMADLAPSDWLTRALNR